MIKRIIKLFIVVIIFTSTCYAQQHVLPLKIVSIRSNYEGEVNSKVGYETSPDDPQKSPMIENQYEIIIDFKVEDSTFVENPIFKIYMSDLSNRIKYVQVTNNMILNSTPNFLSVKLEVVASKATWLNFYCFPDSFDPHSPSIWQLKNGTDVQRAFFLR